MSDCEILQGLGLDMDLNTVAALMRRRYTPARKNGKAIDVEWVFKVSFACQGGQVP